MNLSPAAQALVTLTARYMEVETDLPLDPQDIDATRPHDIDLCPVCKGTPGTSVPCLCEPV